MIEFSELKVKVKFVLTIMCVWPDENSTTSVKIFGTIISAFILSVLVKNMINPEKESIENAFTLSNGLLIIIVFWVSSLLHRDCFLNFFHFILNDANIPNSPFDLNTSNEAAKEVIQVLKWFIIFLPAGTVAKFFLPVFDFVSNLGTNRTVEFPPAMVC